MPDRTAQDPGVRTRRALALVVLSTVLPGSAQRLVGNRQVGQVALRVLGAVAALVAVTVVVAVLARGFVVGLLLNPAVALAVKIGVWILFAAWVLLLLDAWRLAQPRVLARGARLALTLLVVTAMGMATVATSFASRALTAAEEVSAVFSGGGSTETTAGRYNVLLLGVDAADDRLGVRPDSINVASVDAETGRTVIFGLPRNLENVPFPRSSPLHDLYPDGYDCQGCRLNAVYTLGEDHADLYPGGKAGLSAVRESVGAILGLEINYHAMVDMGGFSALVDALGGITVDSSVRVPIGGGTSRVSGYIEPGDDLHLDGYHALWYARSRHDSSDYERMARQKCVLSAMASQLDPGTVAARFVALSRASSDLVSTDVPPQEVVGLTELALKAKALPLTSIDFSPPLINSADPDFDLIRDEVASAIESRGPVAATPAPSPSGAPDPTPTAAQPSVQPPAADDGDVEWLCRVS